MFTDSPEATNFLRELYDRTQGDPSVQVSMYDVGAALGMEKSESGKVAEDLIGNGLVEVKTLSGGIALSAQGLESLQATGEVGASGDEFNLHDVTVLEDKNRQAVDALIADLKTGVARNTPAYAALEEMVIDLKTAETQLLSPKPKGAILIEVFRSLQSALATAGNQELAARLKQIIGP